MTGSSFSPAHRPKGTVPAPHPNRTVPSFAAATEAAQKALLRTALRNDIISATVPELSRLSGLGQSTIWAMLHDGRLESIAIGRRRLVLIDSYHRLIEQQRASPPQDARRNGAVPALGTTGAVSRRELARNKALNCRVAAIGLSNRARNALIADGVEFIGDLVQQTKEELLQIPNFGRRCLAEVEAALAERKLTLGAQHSNWDRPADTATAAAAE